MPQVTYTFREIANGGSETSTHQSAGIVTSFHSLQLLLVWLDEMRGTIE
jgi:hypothetical protein